MNTASKGDRTMATKVTIPKSFGEPTATFWINQTMYVLKTGVEIDAPDEVAALISQYEDHLKNHKPYAHPDTVDVVFTFDVFHDSQSFYGTSNKSLEDILGELGGRGVEHINLRCKSAKILGEPFRVEVKPTELIAYWINIGGASDTEYKLRLHKATITSTGGLSVKGEPKAIFTGAVI